MPIIPHITTLRKWNPEDDVILRDVILYRDHVCTDFRCVITMYRLLGMMEILICQENYQCNPPISKYAILRKSNVRA